MLADHFFEQARDTYRKKGMCLSADARAAIAAYPWPGNVRELRNCLERTLVVHDGEVIEPIHLGLPVAAASVGLLPKLEITHAEMRFNVGTTLHEIELEAIRRTLLFTGGDKAKAAEILGINQRTIYRKLPEL